MQYEYPSSRHSHMGYPYRVWIYSFISACLLVLEIPFGISDARAFGSLLDWLVSFVLFLPLFIPVLVIYMLFFWRLVNTRLSSIHVKMLLAVIGIGLLYAESLLIQVVFVHSLLASSLIDGNFIPFSIIFVIFSTSLSLKKR